MEKYVTQDELHFNKYYHLILNRVNYFARKFKFIDREDILSAAYLAYTKAKRDYDPNKAKFTTCLYKYIFNEVRNLRFKESRFQNNIVTFAEIYSSEYDEYLDSEVLERLENLQDERIKTIIKLRLGGVYFRHIGKQFGVSGTRIQQLYDIGIQQLREQLC